MCDVAIKSFWFNFAFKMIQHQDFGSTYTGVSVGWFARKHWGSKTPEQNWNKNQDYVSESTTSVVSSSSVVGM